MNFKQKIMSELEKGSVGKLFANFSDSDISRKIVVPLSNFDYVSKHPNTDLEKYYLQQVVSSISLRVAEELFHVLDVKKIKPEEYSQGIIFCDYTGSSLFPSTLLMPLLEGYYVVNNVSLDLDLELMQQGTVDLDEGSRSSSDFLIINLKVKMNE